MNDKWFPYIKPTRRKHSSGYRVFEVGYVHKDEKTKEIIAECTDHVAIGDFGEVLEDVHIDLLNNGCIRFFCHEHDIKWSHDSAISDAYLVYGTPVVKLTTAKEQLLQDNQDKDGCN